MQQQSKSVLEVIQGVPARKASVLAITSSNPDVTLVRCNTNCLTSIHLLYLICSVPLSHGPLGFVDNIRFYNNTSWCAGSSTSLLQANVATYSIGLIQPLNRCTTLSRVLIGRSGPGRIRQIGLIDGKLCRNRWIRLELTYLDHLPTSPTSQKRLVGG